MQRPPSRVIAPAVYHAPTDQIERLTRPILLKAKTWSQTSITLNPGYGRILETCNHKRSISELARKFGLLAQEACILTCGRENCLFCASIAPASSKKRKTNTAAAAATIIKILSTPPSLRILAMRVVVVHRRRPHQFELTLSFDLINQVWLHLPLRFLAAQRLARFYNPVLCTRVNTTAACHCPTEIWMYQSRVVKHEVVLCARCLGFDLANPVFKDILSCRACRGSFARCGCACMAHIRVCMYYDRQGNMVQIMLHSNHSGWKRLGHADLIGTGYLDGPLDWTRDIAVYPNSLNCIFPPPLTFNKGIRIKKQTEQYLPTGRLLRLCWPSQAPTAPIKYIVEFPVADLCIMKKSKRSGSHLFLETQAQLRKSRTVAIFVEAARLYMDIMLTEQINVALAGKVHRGHFKPSYRNKRGTNWPRNPC